jgi:pimeloyl-ACP methyl ester carboxylesterase
MRDPYIPARFGRDYAEALGAGEPIELPDAGHWPWLEAPRLVETIANFLTAEAD